jgi:SAM-dependent methyltransferase
VDKAREGSLGKEYKAKAHYQDGQIVKGYEEKRFSGLSGWLREWAEERAIKKALRQVGTGLRILDMPCGTGRFRPLLREGGNEVVHADISQEMLGFARERADSPQGVLGYIRCEAESLPFRSAAFGSVLCFRFLPHLPVETRKMVLSELARVSRGPFIVDYRYKLAFRSLSRWIRYRLGVAKPLRPRYSISQISSELGEAGVVLLKWVLVVWLFSEKVVLLCQRRSSP